MKQQINLIAAKNVQIMKKQIIIALVLVSSLTQAQVSVDWFNYPGGVSVATDASNNVYTANWDYNPAGDITLTKRNAAGSILWNVFYDNTDNTRHEVATWVETDNAGNILVSGTIRSGYSNPVNAASLLMKFNPAGTLLWRVIYESSFDGSSTKKCIVDANDNIYVLGRGTGTNGQVTKVKKFNSSGVAIWNYFDNVGIGAPVNFKFTPDNNIVISHRGITGSINGYSKIDLNGNNIWSLAGVNSLTVGDAAGDAFGNTYIINGEYVVTNPGSIIKKLSPTGTVLWSQTNIMTGNRVEVGTDNNPVISGYPNSGTFGAAFMKYDNNGNVLWQNLDADGPGLALLAHAQLKLDGLNAAYLAAGTMSLMAVCKVNSNGTSAWTATTSSGYAVCLDFGTDNSVYVTGGTTARLLQSAPIPVPIAPSNLSATVAGSSAINLTWTDNASDETSFILQRSLTSGSGFSTIATLPTNTTSYTNTGLNSSTTYYYRVQAANSGGSSSWSNTANATTASALPAAPTNLMALAPRFNLVNLSWNPSTDNVGVAGYYIYRTDKGTTPIATVTTTTYADGTVKASTTYSYYVRAFDAAGNKSGNSNTATVTTPKRTNKETAGASGYEHGVKGLSPNPFNPTTTITYNVSEPSDVSIEVVDALGRIALTTNNSFRDEGQYSELIKTQNLSSGIYFFRLTITPIENPNHSILTTTKGILIK